MACQPAVDVGAPLKMARDAFVHAPVFVRQPLQVLDLAMAFLAGDLAVDMALMVEQHVFGHVVDFNPGR